MRRETLEADLDQLFAKRLSKPSFLKRHVLAPLRQKSPTGPNVAQIQAQLESLGTKRQRILDSYFEGVINGTERDDRLAAVVREKSILMGILRKGEPRKNLDLDQMAEVFSVFTGFDLLERDDKRQLLNTITPSIVVANYKIEGLWIGLERNHTAAVYQENERIWLPLAA